VFSKCTIQLQGGQKVNVFLIAFLQLWFKFRDGINKYWIVPVRKLFYFHHCSSGAQPRIDFACVLPLHAVFHRVNKRNVRPFKVQKSLFYAGVVLKAKFNWQQWCTTRAGFSCREALGQGCTTFSLLPGALRLRLWITAASEFKIFYIFHCFCSAFTHWAYPASTRWFGLLSTMILIQQTKSF